MAITCRIPALGSYALKHKPSVDSLSTTGFLFCLKKLKKAQILKEKKYKKFLSGVAR
jgi:hypothetical protein